MKIIKSHISGLGKGPFDHERGECEHYYVGPFASGITLTVVIEGDTYDEEKLKDIKEKIGVLIHKA